MPAQRAWPAWAGQTARGACAVQRAAPVRRAVQQCACSPGRPRLGEGGRLTSGPVCQVAVDLQAVHSDPCDLVKPRFDCRFRSTHRLRHSTASEVLGSAFCFEGSPRMRHGSLARELISAKRGDERGAVQCPWTAACCEAKQLAMMGRPWQWPRSCSYRIFSSPERSIASPLGQGVTTTTIAVALDATQPDSSGLN